MVEEQKVEEPMQMAEENEDQEDIQILPKPKRMRKNYIQIVFVNMILLYDFMLLDNTI